MKNINDKPYHYQVYVNYDFGEPQYVVKYDNVPVGGQGRTMSEALKNAEQNLYAYLDSSFGFD